MKLYWLGVAFVLVILLALVAVRAYAGEDATVEPPNPYCTWVEEVSHQEWVPPTTHTVVVVDQEAYDETIPGECYPAVTHEELSCDGIGVSFTHWYFPWATVFVEYVKSNDPNHCHMPSSSELKNDYGMTNAEKTFFVQHKPNWLLGNMLTIVDEEAYCDPDTVIHHDAITHEETVTDTEGYWVTVVDEEGYWDCPDMCEYDQTIPADDPLCVPPVIPPPPPPEPECEWKGTGTAVFELWSGPDYTGDYATMYVYDFGDGYPEGVSVDRQSCVLGWVAQTDTGPWEIDRNTCSGNLRWHGLEFIPSERVIRHQACARDNECLAQ